MQHAEGFSRRLVIPDTNDAFAEEMFGDPLTSPLVSRRSAYVRLQASLYESIKLYPIKCRPLARGSGY